MGSPDHREEGFLRPIVSVLFCFVGVERLRWCWGNTHGGLGELYGEPGIPGQLCVKQAPWPLWSQLCVWDSLWPSQYCSIECPAPTFWCGLGDHGVGDTLNAQAVNQSKGATLVPGFEGQFRGCRGQAERVRGPGPPSCCCRCFLVCL